MAALISDHLTLIKHVESLALDARATNACDPACGRYERCYTLLERVYGRERTDAIPDRKQLMAAVQCVIGDWPRRLRDIYWSAMAAEEYVRAAWVAAALKGWGMRGAGAWEERALRGCYTEQWRAFLETEIRVDTDFVLLVENLRELDVPGAARVFRHLLEEDYNNLMQRHQPAEAALRARALVEIVSPEGSSTTSAEAERLRRAAREARRLLAFAVARSQMRLA